MKFKINNLVWEIDLASSENIALTDKIKPSKETKIPANPVPADDVDPCGITFRSKLHIFINDNLNDDLFERTIIHEMTHAFMWSYGLTQFEDFNEEQVCDFMETHGRAIFDLVNKMLPKLLKERHNREKAYQILVK